MSTAGSTDDHVVEALDNLGQAAEEAAREQKELAKHAKTAGRLRRRGLPWSQVFEQDHGRSVLDVLSRTTKRLTEAGARFRQAVAHGLLHEGLTTREIGRLLGVTHQRVSALLNRNNNKQ